jgi:hypothetical protein
MTIDRPAMWTQGERTSDLGRWIGGDEVTAYEHPADGNRP